MSLIGRGAPVLAGFVVLVATGAVRCEDLDAKKTGPQLFESACTACHRGPQGLAKNSSASALVGFLRQHYTTGPGPAGQLAAYLLANPGDGRPARLTPAAAKPDAAAERQQGQPPGPSHQSPTAEPGGPRHPNARANRRQPGAPGEPPVDRQAGPTPDQPAPNGRAQRAARKPADPAVTEGPPSARAAEPSPGRPQAGPSEAKPAAPVAAEAAAPQPQTAPAPVAASSEAPAAPSPTEAAGDQSAFSAPTP